MSRRCWTGFVLLAVTALAGGESAYAFQNLASDKLPTVEEMVAAKVDVWGEAAMRRPEGPSYEFFRDLLPPVRYVNAAFRHFPIVLSAPRAGCKARWVSNGSAINARADKKPMWREVGFPVNFKVGRERATFGEDMERLDGPRYLNGFLPVVQIAYTHERTVYRQEVFASVNASLSECGAIFVRFTAGGSAGPIAAHIDTDSLLRVSDRTVCDSAGNALVMFGSVWKWDASAKELTASLDPEEPASLIVFTRPLPPPLPRFDESSYDAERKDCTGRWQEVRGQAMQLDVPEPIVNNAWRSLVIGNLMIANGDRMNYSAGNAYDHLYEAECGDAVRSLLLYGLTDAARPMVGPLLDFNRQATRFHVAGHKLQLLAHYYWLTRDEETIRRKEPVWKPVAEFIISSRERANGLLPRDNYAGDINRQVYSLNSNANCWRGLRDLGAVLEDIGEAEQAKRLHDEAASFRQAILQAVAKSERHDVQPPFIPNALFGEEEPHDPLTATRMGSYYDLMAPYIIGSGVLGLGSERETWMIEYLQRHGGIAMGMVRSQPHQGEFAGQPGVNVLYGLRYMLALLRRDDRERALVGFYGQLAQAMTRDTFIGAEGTRFLHGDRFGRSMYLPPNSASNAMFLTTLRYLLIQDWDCDDDGKPDTLRLLYAVPRRWLSDGAAIRAERAPTMFGPVSFRVSSHLSRGELTVEVAAPPRRPREFLLRLPLPPGWRIISASHADQRLPLRTDGSIDLTDLGPRPALRIQVEKVPN